MPKIFEDTIVVVSGGGGGGTGNVAIGPDYGEVGKPAVGVRVAMPAAAFAADRGVGVRVAMPATAFAGGRGVGVHVDLAAAFAADRGVGVRAAMPATAFAGDRGIGVHAAMPALAFLGDRGVGVEVGGTYLGAPAYQSITSVESDTTGTQVVVPAPASIVEGDLLVAIVGRSGINADAAPSGWVEILQQTRTGTLNVHISAWRKIATASEPADYTFTWAAAGSFWGCCLRLTATDPTTPVNTSGSTPSSVTDPVAPALTTGAANCFLIAACIQISTVDLTYTAPSGYVERAELNGSTIADVHNIDGTVATKVQAASGSVAAATMDSSTLVAVDSIAVHIAIVPGLFTMN